MKYIPILVFILFYPKNTLLGQEEFTVNLALSSNIQSLHPINSRYQNAKMIHYATHQTLLNIDFQTLETLPVLAKERPKIKIIDDKIIELEFEIRPQAQWANGSAITAHDVVFTLKTIKIPQTHSLDKKPIIQKIKDIRIDSINPKKFTAICERDLLIEGIWSDLNIIPQYIYDYHKILDDYDLTELDDTALIESFEEDGSLIKFAGRFNETYSNQRGPLGSGPYWMKRLSLDEVILIKKENWWGKTLEKESHWFQAHPDTIRYKVERDKNRLLQDYSLAVTSKIQCPKEMQSDYKNCEFTKEGYDYLGFNFKHPILQDVKVRQALAYFVDVEHIIQEYLSGLAEPAIFFFSPNNIDLLDKSIPSYQYNLRKAKKLLKQAGWKDANGDGILEKKIDGKQYDFKLRLITNNENSQRKEIAEYLSQNASKIGLKLEVKTPTWRSFTSLITEKDYDLVILGWLSYLNDTDPTPVWHSKSVKEGNFYSYSNPKVDELIEKVKVEMDREKRIEYYKELQRVFYEDLPVIFLYYKKEALLIHKKYQNAYCSPVYPYYWIAGFKLED